MEDMIWLHVSFVKQVIYDKFALSQLHLRLQKVMFIFKLLSVIYRPELSVSYGILTMKF